MSFNHRIGLLASRLNLAICHKKSCVPIEKSPTVFLIIKLLMEKQLIKNFLITKNFYLIFLHFKIRTSVFKNVKVISIPSKRVYANVYQVNSLVNLHQNTFFLISTTKGIYTSYDCVKLNLGGEVLFSINT
jgi:ribosomal protein S8